MQVCLRLPGGKTTEVDISTLNLSELKKKVQEIEGVQSENLVLYQSSKQITDESTILSDALIEVNFGLSGGAGAAGIPDHLRDLAMKFKCNKMVCRKCYARLPANAKNCRKRKCGHCANIRPKKKIKEKEK